jgi:hypothetical protein
VAKWVASLKADDVDYDPAGPKLRIMNGKKFDLECDFPGMSVDGACDKIVSKINPGMTAVKIRGLVREKLSYLMGDKIAKDPDGAALDAEAMYAHLKNTHVGYDGYDNSYTFSVGVREYLEGKYPGTTIDSFRRLLDKLKIYCARL